MNVRTLKSRFAVLAVLLAAASPLFAVTYTATTSGDFNTPSNYTPVPTGSFVAGDTIAIASGVDMTLSTVGTTTIGSLTFASGGGGSLTINSGATLSISSTNANGYALELTDPGVSSKYVQVNTGGTLTTANNVAVYGGSGGGFTYLRSTGGTISINSIVFNGAIPTKGSIDLSTGAGLLKLAGNLPSGGTVSAGTNSIVEFNGTSALQAIGSYSFYNLKVNKASGTAQLSAGVDINGDLNVAVGTFSTNGQLATIDGNIIGSGAIDMSTGGELRLAGNFNHSGTFTAGTGTVTYNGGSAVNVKATTYNALAFSIANTNGLFLGNVTTSSLIMDASTFMGLSGNSLTVSGAATINGSISFGAGSVSFPGAIGTISGSGIIGPNTTIASRTISSGASLNFLGNLTVAAGSTVTNSGTVDIDGSLIGTDVASQWVNATNASLTIGADAFSTFGQLSASASGNTVTFDGNGLVTLPAVTYQNLVLTSTGASTKSYTGGSLPVNSNLTISGSTTFNASSPITVGGNVTIGASATFSAGTNTINVGGNWSRTGTFTPGSSTVNFFGTNAQSIDATTFHHLSFNGLGVKTLNGAMDVNGNFGIGGGSTVNAGVWVHNVAGTWTNSGTFNAGTSEIIFDPTVSVTVGGTTFYKLTVAATGSGGIVLNSAVSVTADLNLTGGDIQLGTNTLTVGGDATIGSGTFLTINTGTFIFGANFTTNGSVNASAGGTVKATGTSAQTWVGATAPNLANLWVFKTSGSLNASLLLNVSGTLTLDGILSTGGAIVSIASSGSVIRNSGWVEGRVSHTFTGPASALYPLGTALGYAPVTFTSPGAGSLDIEIQSGPQPNNTNGGAGLLQIYWTVYSTAITGNANLTFGWTAGAVNGTEANYEVGRYNGGAWSHPAATVSTNTASVSNTPFYIGDWTAGEPAALGGATTFEITGPTTVTAGTANTFTITAKDSLNNTDTGYTGDHTLQFSGASTAPWTVDAPTATDKNAAPVVFANNTVVTFTNGVATTSIKLYRSETATLNVLEPSGPATASAYNVQVDPAAATQLDVSNVTFLSSPYANAPFSADLTSYDAYGNDAPVAGSTSVALTLTNCGGCTGTLGGTTTGTIPAGSDTVNLGGLTYSAPDANVIFTATRTAGDVLTSNDSVGYTFAAQLSGLVVTTDADSGAGSLREALQRNNNGECSAACQITFNITPAGAHEIVLVSALPSIQQPATIDGSSQPGYTGTPIIALNGSATTGNGLDVESDNSTIQGLIIRGFSGAGIAIANFDVLNVQNCWIGTNLTGSAPSANGRGIKLTNAYACSIGGNVISGNTGAGIQLFGNTTYTTIAGNYIGTNASGTAAVPNGSGINIEDSSSNNTVGGAAAGDRNVISGNLTAGIYFQGSAIVGSSILSNDVHALPLIGSNVNANDLKNNYIGTNAAGTAAIPNAIGVDVAGNATANAIGAAGNGNVISGNSSAGISVSGSGNNDTYIRGNVIGLAADAVSPLGNGGDGITLAGTSATHVGGIGGGDDNQIAYNAGNGVQVASGSGNDIVSDGFHDNTLRAIELGGDGTDLQDDGNGDIDGGANGKQNWPVISGVQLAGSNLLITASMSSAATPAGSLRLQFYKADASGEGKSLITSICSIGNTFGGTSTVPAGSVGIGDSIVAIATSYTDGACSIIGDGTSEFSPAATVAACTPPAANITAGGPTTFCAGGSVTLTASSGASWLWSNGASSQSITVSGSGNYSVTVTDASGCSAVSAATTVTVNPIPTASATAGGPTTFCTGGSVTLTSGAVAGNQWLLNGNPIGGATGQQYVATASGSYSVTVTANGCTSPASTPITVTVNPPPTATITPSGPTSFCPGGSVVLDASPGTSWLWSNGATTQGITVTTSGSYSVTVTSGGCSTTSAPMTVTVYANPTPTITASGPTTFCAGGSVNLTASAGASWLWSNGATTQTINVTASGSYLVTVTTGDGCSASSAATSVTVNPAPTATITASGPTTFCAGGSVTLDAGVHNSYLWSNGATTQSIVVTTTGNYSVTVTDAGCSTTSAPTSVSVNPVPLATITQSGPTSFCAGGSVTLTASNGASWLWSNGATTQAITATTSGNYFVTITNAAGCSAQSAPLTVNVSPAPAATITAGGPTSFCAGGSVVLTASNASSWLWSTGETTQSINVTAGGNYTVTVTDGLGCSATSAPATVTVNPAPAVTITGPTGTCPGGSVTLDAGNFASYLWSNGATTQTINVTPGSTTTYSVTVTNGSGCTASDSHTVTVGTATIATIAAPAGVCANSGGHQASVPFQSGATYVWTISGGTIDNGAGTSAILFTANPSGNVTIGVTVTQGSCTSSGNVNIPIGAVPSPVITGPSSVCPNASFTLDAGAGYDAYLWSNGATTPTITVSQNVAQTYSVSVTSNGCSASVSKTVTMSSTASANINAPAFVEPSSAGHAASVATQPGATYLWSVANGTLDSGQGTSAITFSSGPSGTVTLSLSVTLGACTASGTASVDIGVAEADLSVTKSGPASVVAGGTIVYTINVTNNGPSVASGLQIVDELPPGVTVVSVQSGFRCTNDPGAVYCTGNGFLGALAPITITVTAPSQPGTIVNNVRVLSSLPDPNPSNDSASVTTTVTAANPNCPIAKAQILAPAPGSSLASPVTFSWTPVPQAIGYRVWVSANGGAEQIAGTTDGAISLSASVPAGALSATVEALFAGCPGTRSEAVRFTVTATDPCSGRTAATPSSPANESIVNSSSVTFQWLAAANADGYRLWISIDGGIPQVLGETTETSLTAVVSRGAMVWWVEALYDGCASVESTRLRFTIPAGQQCGTQAPSLLAPSAGATVNAGNVTFSWSAVSGAVGYELWLAHQDGTPTLVRAVGPGTTSVVHEVPPGTLAWFVRVLLDRCPARDSETRRFSATEPAACAGNDRPIAIEPLEKAQVSSPVTFSWSPSQGATRYELYVAHGNQPADLLASSGLTQSTATLPNGRHRWFVRTYFGEGCQPLDSDEQSLVVVPRPAACSPLPAPVISAPGQISSAFLFSIHWSPVPGATSYQLELADNAAFTGAEQVSTDKTHHQLVRLNNGTAPATLYVRVRALDNRCTPFTLGAFGSSTISVLPLGTTEGAAVAGDGQIVTLNLVLGPELAGQTYSAVPTQPWLTIMPSRGGIIPPGGLTLIIHADTRQLPLGTSLGGITINTSGPAGGRVRTQATSTTSPVSISIVSPVTPTPKNAPPPDALLIPAVAHADGINAKFESDVRVSNTSPRLMKYQVTFTPSGETGIAAGKQTTFSVDPGRTVALDDILKSWFGTGDASVTGVLEIRPLTQSTPSTSSAAVGALANLVTFASSRTYNQTDHGTFGQFVPAIPFANFVGKATSTNGSVLSLQQIAQSDRFRTNLGFVEGSGQPASLQITVFGSNGAKVTNFPVQLAGGQHLQLNSFLAAHGVTSLNDGRVEVQVTSSTGKVTAYASVLDNQTADPLLVTPVTLNDAGQSKWVVPGVADLANGVANWQTDMRIFNAGETAVDATLSFYSQRGGEPIVKTLTLPPGEVRQLDKTVTTLFNTTNDGGAVHITTPSASRLIATARTYNQTTTGTYGQFISAVTPSEAVGVGSRPLQLLQLEESDRYRSNIGFAEVTGKPVKLEIGIVPPDAKATAFIEVDLAPNEFRQLNSLLGSLALGDTHNARITVRAISGDGRATAYASVVDMQTQDPTYIPAQ